MPVNTQVLLRIPLHHLWDYLRLRLVGLICWLKPLFFPSQVYMGLGDLLHQAHQFLHRAMQTQQQQLSRGQPSLPNTQAQTDFFIRTLSNEPNQKWLEIPWVTSAADAVALAKQTRKPIFVEIIVGRYADKSSEVC
jgi:hypothetical protein